jgi:hypothetical protein
MPRYLISFETGAMAHIPDEDWADVGKASHAVVQEAKDAGQFIAGGGLVYDDNNDDDVEHAVVDTDGTITDGPFPESNKPMGGGMIVNVPTREAALKWAAKNAAACRCPQNVRKFMYDPEQDD